jgi:hypothetical protein
VYGGTLHYLRLGPRRNTGNPVCCCSERNPHGPWGSKLYPMGLAHTKVNGRSQIPGAARLLGSESFWRHNCFFTCVGVLFLLRDRTPTDNGHNECGPKRTFEFGGDTLRGETKERWRELCERVVSEQDPDRFEATIQELLQVLEGRETGPPRDRVYVPPSEKLINISSPGL